MVMELSPTKQLVLMTEVEPSAGLINAYQSVPKQGEPSEALKVILKEEAVNVQKKKLLYMFVQLVIMFILKVFVGSKSKKSAIGITPCSTWFWVLSWLYIPVCVLSSFFLGSQVLK